MPGPYRDEDNPQIVVPSAAIRVEHCRGFSRRSRAFGRSPLGGQYQQIPAVDHVNATATTRWRNCRYTFVIGEIPVIGRRVG